MIAWQSMGNLALLLFRQHYYESDGKVGKREPISRRNFSMVTQAKGVDPRVKRTRKLLQQALIELLQEKGFASISIQDIAERATVNRATHYAHFTDKYALLDSIIREQFQRVVASKLPSTSGEGVNTLGVLIQGVFDFLGEFHQDCKPSDTQFDPLIERAVQQELAEILLSWLKHARAAGTPQRVR